MVLYGVVCFVMVLCDFVWYCIVCLRFCMVWGDFVWIPVKLKLQMSSFGAQSLKIMRCLGVLSVVATR